MTEDDSSVRCPVVEPGPDFPAPPLLPLPCALHDADLPRVRELLAATPAPDLTQTDKLGQTPLVVAVRRSERDADRAAAQHMPRRGAQTGKFLHVLHVASLPPAADEVPEAQI